MLNVRINKKLNNLTKKDYRRNVNSVKGIALYSKVDIVGDSLTLSGNNGNFILVDVSEIPTWKDLNDSMLGGIVYLFYDASTYKFIKSYVLR